MTNPSTGSGQRPWAAEMTPLDFVRWVAKDGDCEPFDISIARAFEADDTLKLYIIAQMIWITANRVLAHAEGRKTWFPPER